MASEAARIYGETICGAWGMRDPEGTGGETLQGVDYRSTAASGYADAWVVGGVHLCQKVGAPKLGGPPDGPRFEFARQYPTSLYFVAGPNAGTQGRNASSTVRRTFNRAAAEDYGVFRAGVKHALKAGLYTMAQRGERVALLALVSGGIYAGPWRDRVVADYAQIVNEILQENVDAGAALPLGAWFERAVLTLLQPPADGIAWSRLPAAGGLAGALSQRVAAATRELLDACLRVAAITPWGDAPQAAVPRRRGVVRDADSDDEFLCLGSAGAGGDGYRRWADALQLAGLVRVGVPADGACAYWAAGAGAGYGSRWRGLLCGRAPFWSPLDDEARCTTARQLCADMRRLRGDVAKFLMCRERLRMLAAEEECAVYFSGFLLFVFFHELTRPAREALVAATGVQVRCVWRIECRETCCV